MRNIKNCLMLILNICLASTVLTLNARIPCPDQILLKTNVSYTHFLLPAAAGTSYVWKADDANIIFQKCDSIVVKLKVTGIRSLS